MQTHLADLAVRHGRLLTAMQCKQHRRGPGAWAKKVLAQQRNGRNVAVKSVISQANAERLERKCCKLPIAVMPGLSNRGRMPRVPMLCCFHDYGFCGCRATGQGRGPISQRIFVEPPDRDKGILPRLMTPCLNMLTSGLRTAGQIKAVWDFIIDMGDLVRIRC